MEQLKAKEKGGNIKEEEKQQLEELKKRIKSKDKPAPSG